MTAGSTARTTIVDRVVASIASLAAYEVPGVVALRGSPSYPGRGAARIPGSSTFRGPGVVCEVGPHEAAVHLSVLVATGHPLPALASAVRSRVMAAVRAMTGLDVTHVDVHVLDLADAEPQRHPVVRQPTDLDGDSLVP